MRSLDLFLGRGSAFSGALAFTLLVTASALADEPGRARILFDAKIFTAEPGAPYAEAVAIKGDKILAVGRLGAVEAAAGPDAERIDLHGKFLMPGILDSHAHPIDGGVTLNNAVFDQVKIDIPKLARFTEKTRVSGKSRQGDIVAIYNVDTGYWLRTNEPNAALNKGPFATQPVILYGSDGHTAWANQAATKRAGITADFIRGLSDIDRKYYGYGKDFAPNGFVVDAGVTKLVAIVPEATEAAKLAAGQAALGYMHENGITGWLDAAANQIAGDVPATVDKPGYLETYRLLAERGELKAHVAAYPVVLPDGGSQQIQVIQALQAKYKGLPNLTIPGLKVFADGVVEFPSQTAALTKAYKNSGKNGALLFTPEKFNALVTEADKLGLVVHVHAIGDLAVKAALDGFEAARKANGMDALPHAITHVQFADPEDIPRFARLKVAAALQLDWALLDPSTNEVVKPYIDADIYRTMYPARSLLDSGAVISGASDWPVSTANPFLAIYQAETRRGAQGVLNADERMPREAMLYAYTRNSAIVLGMLDSIGTIAPGKQADLVLVDRDVLTGTAEEARDAKVVWTLFGGLTVYGTGP
jgi:predicted amidohydrolase YtcJ